MFTACFQNQLPLSACSWRSGGAPGAVVTVACLESRRLQARAPLWHSSFKETKCLFSAHSWRFNIVGSLRDREVASSVSDRRGSNFESYMYVWKAVSSPLLSPWTHHPQEILLAQFSLDVLKGGIKPLSFHFICRTKSRALALALANTLNQCLVFAGDWRTMLLLTF